MFLLIGLLAGGLAYNSIGSLAGGVMSVIGVEALSMLALGFWLDVMTAGGLSTSPGLSPYTLVILHAQLPIAVLLMACPLVYAIVNGDSAALGLGLVAAPVIAIVTYAHVNLLQWMLAAQFGGTPTAAFSSAFDNPNKIRELDYSGLNALATQRINHVIWGPTAKTYCVVALVAALSSAVVLRGLLRSAVPTLLVGVAVAGVSLATLVPHIPPHEQFQALPGQNDTCGQRISKISEALARRDGTDSRRAAELAAYHPECLPPPPAITARVQALAGRKVLVDASGSSGLGLEYDWLTGDINHPDSLTSALETYTYTGAGRYELQLIVRDVFGRSLRWTSPPVTVR